MCNPFKKLFKSNRQKQLAVVFDEELVKKLQSYGGEKLRVVVRRGDGKDCAKTLTGEEILKEFRSEFELLAFLNPEATMREMDYQASHIVTTRMLSVQKKTETKVLGLIQIWT
jgi:hypothetical protein